MGKCENCKSFSFVALKYMESHGYSVANLSQIEQKIKSALQDADVAAVSNKKY